MKLLIAHDQGVANFSTDDKQHDFVALDIIQNTEITRPQFELRKRVGPKPFDCLRWRQRLVREPDQDCGFQYPLLANRQGS
jgi:hypothetical protein